MDTSNEGLDLIHTGVGEVVVFVNAVNQREHAVVLHLAFKHVACTMRITWKHGPPMLNPAVVMIAMSGLVRAPVADFKTFSKSALTWACSSSSTASETDKPSADLASDEAVPQLSLWTERIICCASP